MFQGELVWYAMCLICGYREVRTIKSGISPPPACPHCRGRSEAKFPIRYGRRTRDGRIRREDADRWTEPVPLGVSRV